MEYDNNTPAPRQDTPVQGWYDPNEGTYHYVQKAPEPPIQKDRRWPTVKAASFFFLVLVGVLLATSSFSSVVVAVFPEASPGVLYALTGIAEIIAMGVPLLIYLKVYGGMRKQLLRANGASVGTWLLLIPISLLAFALNSYLTDAWVFAVSFIGTPVISSIPNPQTPAGIATMFISLCVIAPVMEELCFRGVLQRGLEGKGARYSIIMTGVLFAFMHMSLVSAPPKVALGIVLCYVAYVTNSVWCAVFIHAINNIFAVLLSYIPTAEASYSTVEELMAIPAAERLTGMLVSLGIAILCAGVTIGLLMLLRRINRTKPRHRMLTEAELMGKGALGITGIKIALIIIAVSLAMELVLTLVGGMGFIERLIGGLGELALLK